MKISTPIYCKGFTKSGRQCRVHDSYVNGDGYCEHHEPVDDRRSTIIRCKAISVSYNPSQPCLAYNMYVLDNGFCKYHNPDVVSCKGRTSYRRCRKKFDLDENGYCKHHNYPCNVIVSGILCKQPQLRFKQIKFIGLCKEHFHDRFGLKITAASKPKMMELHKIEKSIRQDFKQKKDSRENIVQPIMDKRLDIAPC